MWHLCQLNISLLITIPAYSSVNVKCIGIELVLSVGRNAKSRCLNLFRTSLVVCTKLAKKKFLDPVNCMMGDEALTAAHHLNPSQAHILVFQGLCCAIFKLAETLCQTNFGGKKGKRRWWRVRVWVCRRRNNWSTQGGCSWQGEESHMEEWWSNEETGVEMKWRFYSKRRRMRLGLFKK